MKTENSTPHSLKSNRWATVFAFSAGILAASPVWAVYDIPDSPLLTKARVPANLLIQLDDSGSMQWDFMPGASNSGQVPATVPVAIQLQTYTRNTLYYNPNITYQPWLTSVAGVRLPATPYTAAYDDDVLAGGAIVNLNTSTALPAISFPTNTTNRIFHAPKDPVNITNYADATQYYRYVLLADGTAKRQVLNVLNVWVDDQVMTGFTWLDRNGQSFTRTIAEEQQNFANWYSYHRTRTKVAKAGISEAFNDLGDSIRVGYDTIWNRNPFRIPVNTDDGLFRGTNRSTFYDRLHTAIASNGTPLRSALRRSGTYFSETGNDGPYGPLISGEQLSCRQNFTILTTDGYWNSDGGFAEANQDNTPGVVVLDKDDVASNTYTPARPYMDNQANVLADVAMRYWKNDLRTDLKNNVPFTTANPAFWQHMVTFGISIGLKGSLDPDTDLARLTSGAINWPNAVADSATAIDDLFHAAVNGRGNFVVANDPQELTQRLQGALEAIIGRIGSASNVSANSVSVGNNTRIFQASYLTGQWTGQINALPITNGVLSTTEVWRATDGIPPFATRKTKIFTYEAGGTSFPAAGQLAFLTQPIADFIMGDQSGEKVNGGVFRDRVNLLGDIISSSPSYSQDSDTIFIGANDGMMHAIKASDGTELFAYVPGIVNLANLKTLVDDPYDHRYLVDGPITVTSKSQTPNKNYLVGSLGRGGKGIYVLDVTTPATFGTSNVMWEAGGSDADMGLVTSRPIITKANTGEQVVIVSNGLNSGNDSPALFVYRLSDGVRLAKITPVDVDGGGPVQVNGNNGLSAATGVDANVDGRIDYVYAGDMLGNLWKFDLSSSLTTDWEVANSGYPMFSAKDPANSNIPQPISGGVAIAYDSSNKPWIYFGTGRFLTAGDTSSTSVQTWYGLRDDNAVIANRSALKQRKVAAAGTFASKKVRAFEFSVDGDMAGKSGWYIDLINPPYGASEKEGERVVGTPLVRGNTVIVSSIIPTDNPCGNTGNGYINAVDVFTGSSGFEGSAGYLDVNGNGSFNDDTLTDANGKKVAIGSVDLGVFMPTDALVLAGTTNELIVVGGSLGGTGTTPFRGSRQTGRISWHEMINN